MDIEGESTSSENTIETEVEKKEDVPFKKPILVGKIGHLPKKIKNIQKPPVAIKPNTDTIEEIQEPDQEHNFVADEAFKKSKLHHSLQYIEPKWAGLPEEEYHFEVLKEGSIIGTMNLNQKSCWVFGRLPRCDIFMQHPTVSRYHAVLQYRSNSDGKDECGYYVYDLGSTHGTFLNKHRLKPRVYVRMQVGHILKIGCSTRSYLLNGPEEDSEKESEFTVTELKQQRKEDMERRENERIADELRKQKEEENRLKREEERGIDWGMGEDADEETDLSENPFAQSTNEDLYLDDPKKTLRGFFEREGLELTYDCSEQGMGQFMCKVALPIDDERGRPIYAEVIHKGKKKDAVIQCALEACRLLDRHGLLRQAIHESRKRKVKDWAENDYYDSDDDTFLDRTGTIEKKREKRMNAKKPQKVETYESLLDKEQKLGESIKSLQNQLREAQEKFSTTNGANPEEEDPLDAFMKDLKQSKPDKSTINKLKTDLVKLKQEYVHVLKLVNLARPANLPPLVPQYSANDGASNAGRSKIMPIFGKRKKIAVVVSTQKTADNISNKTVDDSEDDENEGSDICRDEKIDGDIEKDSVKTRERVQNNSDSQDLSISLLKECQETFRKILEKLQYTVNNISSDDDEASKVKKFHKLLHSVREGRNNLEEALNYYDIRVDKPSATSTEIIVEDEDTNAVPIEETVSHNSDIGNQEIKKRKNQRRIQQRQEKLEIEKQKGYKEDAQKEDYNMWLPPGDQTGDGRTKLNEKFGY